MQITRCLETSLKKKNPPSTQGHSASPQEPRTPNRGLDEQAGAGPEDQGRAGTGFSRASPGVHGGPTTRGLPRWKSLAAAPLLSVGSPLGEQADAQVHQARLQTTSLEPPLPAPKAALL